MTQRTDPFVHLAWGWSSGEDGWGTGLNNNLITYAFFHNRRFDGSVANVGLLPAATSGQAYFIVADNTFYLSADGAWHSAIPPIGMTFTLKSSEAVYRFTGGSLVLDTKAISDITGLQTALDSKVDDSEVGAANGVAPLGADSKIPSAYLPEGGSYQGTWNATTNTPTITSGVGSNGDFYKVSVGGTTTIDGVSSWSIGDEIRFNGTVWQRIPNSAGVTSVNGNTGAVVLTATDVGAAPSSHVGSGGTQHPNATTSVAGFQSAADKIKLDGVASGATANQTDAYLLARANHTGTQAQSTVVNLVTDLSAKQATLVSGTNIKTINGASILGSGDLVISGGGGVTTFTGLTDTPSSYIGNAEKALIVKLDESGLEFVTLGTAAFNNTGDFASASHTHPNATTSLAGFMSAADKIKLDAAAPLASPTFTGTVVLPATTSIGAVTNTEISYLSGVTSSIQTQLSNKQPIDADLTAIAALAGTSGLLRKTAANTWSLDTASYITGNQTVTLSGDITGSGTTAITTTLANSGVSAGTYKSVTVDAKGRVTAGTNPTTFAGFGIVDTINNLSNVTITSITSGEILKWNGTAFINNTLAEAGIQPAGSYLTGNQTITLGGDVSGSGTTSITVTLDSTGVTASTYGTSIQVPTIAVDAKGRITSASNTTIRTGTTAQTGVLQVTDSVSSTSTTSAASPNSVKTAYDLANGKQNALGYTPVQQGTGVSQLGNSVKIGYNAAGVVKVTIDSTDLGYFVADETTPLTNWQLVSETVTKPQRIQVGALNRPAGIPDAYYVVHNVEYGAGCGTLVNSVTGRVYGYRKSSNVWTFWDTGDAANLSTGTVNNARLNAASTSAAGIVQLTTSTSSTSTTLAPTASALKTTYDLANGKQAALGYTPVQQGTGVDQVSNTVKIGWSAVSKLKATVDSTNLGNIALEDWVFLNYVLKSTPAQTFQSLGTVSGSVSVSAGSGIHVLATVNGNTTWTFPSPSSTEAHAITLELTNGGAHTMTWPASTRWAGGVAPTLTASGTDVLVFTKAGTANWRGYLSAKDSK